MERRGVAENQTSRVSTEPDIAIIKLMIRIRPEVAVDMNEQWVRERG